MPYIGPETVVDLLQRVGGLSPDAAPAEVQVVRGNVAEGETPEIFHVDLQAIVVKQDQASNVRLQPSDQIYVGQSRRSSFARAPPLAPRRGAAGPASGTRWDEYADRSRRPLLGTPKPIQVDPQ